MKVEDLMIGDWVFIKDYPMSPQPIQVKKEHFVRSLVEFKPIPLTPAILEKNGFIYRDEFQLYWELNNLFIYGCNPYYMFCGCRSINLYYVHQLQHALKLCGIDKELII